MVENVINSLFGYFDRLRRNNSLVFNGLREKKKKKNSFASLTLFFFYAQALEHE